VGEHRVVHDLAAEHLCALDFDVRAGGRGPQRRLRTGDVARRAQQRQRDLSAVVDHFVLEQPVVQEREPARPVGRVDEAPGDERREAELLRAALGREPAAHDRERALRVGSGDPSGQGEVRA
jgi:hypothetical protein